MVDGKLTSEMRMGTVSLTVSDLARSISFYEASIGLRLNGRAGNEASLGTGRRELLRLVEEPGARLVPRRTGLYHFALLLPSRQALGNALRNLIATQTNLTGGADHLVSEALYLDDPDGNGIEIYRDRPREAWERRNGVLQMATLPLDYEDILSEADSEQASWRGLPADTVMGHVHLHVSYLAQAVEFYEQVIGFELQMQLGDSAAFLSAGGYHHHLGLNTWAGVGAPPPPVGAVGLRHYIVELPDEAAIAALIERLQEADVSYEKDANGVAVYDPSRNKLIFVQRL